MKTCYEVRLGLRGEGYAFRTVGVEAESPEAAKEKALALYISMIDVDEPIEVHGGLIKPKLVL